MATDRYRHSDGESMIRYGRSILIMIGVLLLASSCSNTNLTTLAGDTSCDWGDDDCNRCAFNVESAFASLETDYRVASRIRFDGYAYPVPKEETDGRLLHRIGDTYEHIQSIGRLSGSGYSNYLVFTHSTESDKTDVQGALAVVRMGAAQATGGGPLGPMPQGDGPDPSTSNRTVARIYSANNHPGGLSVLGHYVYVAQWCQPHGAQGCSAANAADHGTGFSVYDVTSVGNNATLGAVNSKPPKHLYYEHTYDDDWMKGKSTASIAAAKLYDGRYLIALGQGGGKQYGFYLASDPNGPFSLHSVFPVPVQTVFGEVVTGIHWGENAAIVTECGSGDLFLMQMEAEGNTWPSAGADRIHLYALDLSTAGDGSTAITMNHVASRTFSCRGPGMTAAITDGASDWCNFDAGAGVYITPTGDLIVYATDWHQSSYGNIRIAEFE